MALGRAGGSSPQGRSTPTPALELLRVLGPSAQPLLENSLKGQRHRAFAFRLEVPSGCGLASRFKGDFTRVLPPLAWLHGQLRELW